MIKVILGCLLVLSWTFAVTGEPGHVGMLASNAEISPGTAQTAQSQDSVTTKERFDLCISMLKAYYDALEGRVAASIGFLIVVIGWLITSEAAREAMEQHDWLLLLALATLTIALIFYSLNIVHWVHRWGEIRAYTDALGYVEPRFYARYDLPSWAITAYIAPVVVLYIFIVLCLIFIKTGRFTTVAKPLGTED